MDIRELREKIDASWRSDRPVWTATQPLEHVEYSTVACKSRATADLVVYMLQHAEVIDQMLSELEHLRRFRDECMHRGAYR